MSDVKLHDPNVEEAVRRMSRATQSLVVSFGLLSVSVIRASRAMGGLRDALEREEVIEREVVEVDGEVVE